MTDTSDNASLIATIQLLARRLAVIDAERAVLDTIHRYAHSLDYGLDAEWVDCFTAGGVFEIRLGPEARDGFPTRGGVWTDAGIAYRGRVELEDFVAHHTSAPQCHHKHLVVNARVEVNDDRATATSYIVRLDVGTDDVIFTRAFGRYIDRLELGEDDVWRFAHRVADSEAVDLRPIRGEPVT